MGKILIIFGSTTGNTEIVAEQVGGIINNKTHEVVVKNVVDAKVEDLENEWDVILLGASTWGEDEIEFQEDFATFYEDMDGAKIKNVKVGLFGCGDSSYEYYCGAIDLLEEKVAELGWQLVNQPLRIDGDPDESSCDIDDWANEILQAITQKQ